MSTNWANAVCGGRSEGIWDFWPRNLGLWLRAPARCDPGLRVLRNESVAALLTSLPDERGLFCASRCSRRSWSRWGGGDGLVWTAGGASG